MNRPTTSLLPMLLLALIALPATAQENGETPAEKKDEPQAKQADTQTVAKGPLKNEVTLDGVFEAVQMSPVAVAPAEWSSMIVERAVAQGDRVAKGQPLIWLKTKDVDEQLRQLHVAQQTGALALKKAEASAELEQQEIKLQMAAAEKAHAVAQQDLKLFLERDRELAVDAAHWSVRRANNSLDYAREELEQLERMYNEDELTEETEEIVLRRARNDVESSERYLRLAELSRDRTLQIALPRQERELRDAAATAQLALEQAKIALPVASQQKKIDLEKMRHEHQKAAQKLATLTKERQLLAAIPAPADGVVYYGECVDGKWATAAAGKAVLKPGGAIKPHQVVMTIVQTKPQRVRVSVAEKQRAEVQAGLAAKIEPTSRPGVQLAGKVESIAAVPAADGAFKAAVSVDADPGQLVPGMTCKVKLVTFFRPDALSAPAKSVFADDGGGRYVLLVTGEGQHERRDVQVGKTVGDRVEIAGGLAEGDSILTSKPN